MPTASSLYTHVLSLAHLLTVRCDRCPLSSLAIIDSPWSRHGMTTSPQGQNATWHVSCDVSAGERNQAYTVHQKSRLDHFYFSDNFGESGPIFIFFTVKFRKDLWWKRELKLQAPFKFVAALPRKKQCSFNYAALQHSSEWYKNVYYSEHSHEMLFLFAYID